MMIDTEVARLFDRRSTLFLTAGGFRPSVFIFRVVQRWVFYLSDKKKKT